MGNLKTVKIDMDKLYKNQEKSEAAKSKQPKITKSMMVPVLEQKTLLGEEFFSKKNDKNNSK